MLHLIIARSKQLIKHEGLLSLSIRVFFYLVHWVFIYENYYLIMSSLQVLELEPNKLMPRIPNLTYKFIKTNQEAEKIATEFNDFRLHHLHANKMLDNGAIAICIYIGFEPAYICWMALSNEASKSIHDIPYHIDFTNKAVFVGSELTIPQFRRRGLKTYGVNLRDKFLKDMGVQNRYSIIKTSNIGNLIATVGRGNIIYARALYLKLFWWKLWRETQISPPLPVEQVVSETYKLKNR